MTVARFRSESFPVQIRFNHANKHKNPAVMLITTGKGCGLVG